MQDIESLVNKAIYYWDWYLIGGELDNLVSAAAFMQDYRELGGEEYKEIEKLIANCVDSYIEKPKEKVKVEPVKIEIDYDEPMIFGYTYDQIAEKQGIPSLNL